MYPDAFATWRPCGVKRGIRELTALRFAAIQAGHAIVEVDHGTGLTLFAQYRRTRVVVIGRGRLPSIILGPFFLQERLLVLIGLGALDHTNRLHVLLDDIADLGDDRRRITTALFEITSLRVENAVHFIDQEGHVSTFAKHRRQNPCQGDDPLEMFHVLGVDEDLEGSAQFMLGVRVEDDVVNRDIESVF